MHLLFRTCKVSFEVAYQVAVNQVCTYDTALLNHKKCIPSSAQLSSAQLRAQQRSAVRCRVVPCPAVSVLCRAVPCGAVRCGAVLRRAVLSFVHRVPGIIRSPGTRYRCVHVCAVYSSLCFLHGLSPLSPRCVFPPRPQITPVPPIRTWHRQQGYGTAQGNRAISSAQMALDIIKSILAPSHGPLVSAPFSCVAINIFFLAHSSQWAASASRVAEPL